MIEPLQVQYSMNDHMCPVRGRRLALLARLALDDVGTNHDVAER